jgi:hypothetical protein
MTTWRLFRSIRLLLYYTKIVERSVEEQSRDSIVAKVMEVTKGSFSGCVDGDGHHFHRQTGGQNVQKV